jgi:Glu-tRNA(Gln) amidotransferase subunit E-like FAD-binding protein
MLDVLTQGQNDYIGNLDGNALQGMRIGVLKELSYATTKTGLRKEANIDDEVAQAFENAVAELKQCGAEVVEVSMPDLFKLSDKTFQNNELSRKEALYDAFKSLLEAENISAVVYPTYLSTPIRSGRDENGKNWNVYDQVNINNCRTLSPSAGIPEITVPIGIHSLGAGIGMEIAAAKTLVGGEGCPAARQPQGDGRQAIAKRLANLLLNEVAALMSRDASFDLLAGPLTFERALQLVQVVEAGNLSTRQAKEVLAAVIAEDKDPAAVIDERGMKQLNDVAALQSIVESVLAAHPEQVASYQAGNTGLLGYFVGQCMKLTHGQANPQLTNELLKKALGEAPQGRM